MGKDKVVIAVVLVVVILAILFGMAMAYRTYRLPIVVESIQDTIDLLKNDSDGYTKMMRLSLYNELARSQKMRDRKTGKIRKFTNEEMADFYTCIGGKEAILSYLNSIEDIERKRKEAEEACYSLKIITDDELVELLKK